MTATVFLFEFILSPFEEVILEDRQTAHKLSAHTKLTSPLPLPNFKKLGVACVDIS
jgi:hypothetical protein